MIMRALLAALLILAAPAAQAQPDHAALARQNELFVQQQMQQERAVALENQLFSLEARLQTEQRLRELAAQQRRPTPSTAPSDSPRPAPRLGGYVSIPDDRLAASNARVREASRPR